MRFLLINFGAMNNSLSLEQSQRTLMHLSPQQVQFVRMLEMNTAEIEDKVRHELDENPALEVAGDSSVMTGDDVSANEWEETSDQMMQADYASAEDMPFEPRPSSGSRISLEINPAAQSMHDSLLEQLGEYDLDDETRRVAKYIIGSLDNNGRMTRTLSAIADDIAIATSRDIPESTVRHAFEVVRSLDPAGIGAVDLRDCLLLQLDRRQPKTLAIRIATDIIRHYYDLFSNLHYDRIRSRLGISLTQLEDALEIIRSLNPKPGNDAGSEFDDRLRHINPDFFVEPRDDGSFSISLTGHIPTLTVEQNFRVDDTTETDNKHDRAARAFIKGRREQAEQFIGLLKRRETTLMAVMRAIVRIQHEFFLTDDPSVIKPMILKDIAALTDLDLSVISRATSGKYVATPGAVYPLKMFFNERPHEDSDTTAMQIMESLRRVIADEDGSAPLSDRALVDALQARGLKLARRTVTKYRERMGIPAARLRRKI